jgi:F420-dependent oxidoreductase-like protein
MPRLGLYLGRLPGFDKRGFDRREMIECVRAADACGYDSIWIPEAWERDAFTTLTELATQTERIGLATGVINVFSRSPAVIAMSAATLDDISGGRFRLGLGTSGALVIRDFHGLSYDKPLTRLKECIQIVRLLLAGERADFEGECFKVQRFKLGFKPARPDIPIYIAALGPKSLAQLGELADGWLPVHWPRERLRDRMNEISAGARRAGREPTSITVAPFVNVVVDNDVNRARDAARLPLAYYVGGMGDFYREMIARNGFADEANTIHNLWQTGRPREAIKAVPDKMVDAISICGPLEQCRTRLKELSESGVLPLVPIPMEGSLPERIRVIESLIQT